MYMHCPDSQIQSQHINPAIKNVIGHTGGL